MGLMLRLRLVGVQVEVERPREQGEGPVQTYSARVEGTEGFRGERIREATGSGYTGRPPQYDRAVRERSCG